MIAQRMARSYGWRGPLSHHRTALGSGNAERCVFSSHSEDTSSAAMAHVPVCADRHCRMAVSSDVGCASSHCNPWLRHLVLTTPRSASLGKKASSLQLRTCHERTMRRHPPRAMSPRKARSSRSKCAASLLYRTSDARLVFPSVRRRNKLRRPDAVTSCVHLDQADETGVAVGRDGTAHTKLCQCDGHQPDPGTELNRRAVGRDPRRLPAAPGRELLAGLPHHATALVRAISSNNVCGQQLGDADEADGQTHVLASEPQTVLRQPLVVVVVVARLAVATHLTRVLWRLLCW